MIDSAADGFHDLWNDMASMLTVSTIPAGEERCEDGCICSLLLCQRFAPNVQYLYRF
jgi:hypothetical protein